MNNNARYFLNKLLGSDFFEKLNVLSKSEIYHPNVKSTSDIADIAHGIQIVPRTIMAFLISELTPMNPGDHKELFLPIPGGAKIHVTKVDFNAYSGQIFKEEKKLLDFMSRTIPSLGIVLMSTFELYEVEKLEEDQKQAPPLDVIEHVESMIEDRLNLHSLINKVVDKKIEERDAIKQLLMAKLTNDLIKPITQKVSPIREFLEKKKKPLELSIQLTKGEQVHCPDCKGNLFDGKVFSNCVCLGDSGKIYIKKSEDGFKIRFGKNWEIENIEMFLEMLRSKNGTKR